MKKWFLMIAVIFGFTMTSLVAFAQEVLPEVPTQDFISFLIQSLGGLKGAGTLAIVAAVVQILIMFLKTPLFGQLFKNVSGSIKLLIVTALSLVGGVVGLMSVEGLTIGAALVHSTTLTAFTVLAHQLYKQFIEKKD